MHNIAEVATLRQMVAPCVSRRKCNVALQLPVHKRACAFDSRELSTSEKFKFF